MTWTILFAFLVVIGIMSLAGGEQVPWANKLRRVKAGVAHKAEWIAPDEVVQAVEDDYLTIMRWLPESMLQSWSQQWAHAPHYLSGLCLKRHQEILKHYRMGKAPHYIGVLRCLHQVEIRHFSENGERCLVIDHQTSRRMATYDYWSHVRLNTQDLGNGTLVYEMLYDKQAKRWKLDRFVQELPDAWKNGGKARVHILSALPRVIGRDN